MSAQHTFPLRQFVFITSLIGLIGLGLTHYYASQKQQDQWQQKMHLYADQISEQLALELEKFKQVPSLLSQDPRVADFIEDQDHNALNKLLLTWAEKSLADTIYVHDTEGTVLASSNFRQADSFVGRNYAFRPYFHQALTQPSAHFVALGLRSKKRGYFFSAPLYQAEQYQSKEHRKLVGVITVKVSLEELEKTLAPEQSQYLVLDNNHIAFLSSQPEWLYQGLVPLSQSQKQTLLATKQYGTEEPEQNPTLNLNGNEPSQFNQIFALSQHFALLGAPNSKGFQVLVVKPKRDYLLSIAQVDVIFVLIFVGLTLLAKLWLNTFYTKRALADLNRDLEHKVEQRTQHLNQSNQELQRTICQYERSQIELKQTQQELTQATKLALLGELSASISHEINQPLAALRTYAENSRLLLAKAHYDLVRDNLDQMIELNTTISQVITRLKVFSRDSAMQHDHDRANLHDCVQSACAILSSKLIKQGVTLKLPSISESLLLKVHPVELNQVLMNLIHNAAQAMHQQSNPIIGIEVTEGENDCLIAVIDNGPGMAVDSLPRLFDPFFTTKPEGLGLGLTISKRIIEQCHGELTAHITQQGGMRFDIRLMKSVSSQSSNSSEHHESDLSKGAKS